MVLKETGFEHMSKVLPGIYRWPTANRCPAPTNAVIATGALWPSLALSSFLVGKNIDPLAALRGGGSSFFSPGGLPHTDLEKLSASLSKSSHLPVGLLSQIKFFWLPSKYSQVFVVVNLLPRVFPMGGLKQLQRKRSTFLSLRTALGESGL